MQVRIELYGIARQRAGVGHYMVHFCDVETTVGSVLAELVRLAPDFAGDCLVAGQLRPELAMNLDGQRFISDPATPIRDGQCLLILSADAGG